MRSTIVLRRRLLVAGVVLLGFVSRGAAITDGKEKRGLLARDSAPVEVSPTDPEVVAIRAVTHGISGEAGLADHVSVVVKNFDTLLAQAGQCQNIVLFLNGMPLRDMPPESCDTTHGKVRYQLYRTPKADAAWHSLLGSPSAFTKEVAVSVGATDQFSIPTKITDFQLEVIPRLPFYAFFALLVAFTVAFTLVCIRSSMIRSGKPGPGWRAPYSLSKFQMAFWTFLVVIAYMFLWLITDELDTITDSVLALIGIGAGTALGAAILESTRKSDATLTSAQTVATVVTQQLQDGVPSPLPLVVADVRRLKTRGFFLDILSDGDGVGFHRVQMFVWTLVLGIIFGASVYHNLSMPDFSATLLALMGISSGTYLGFKVPEGTIKE